MQRDDIITGIKQSLERGYSLEKSKQSFINAGYPPQDVEDSARVFLGVSSSIPQQFSNQNQTLIPIPTPGQQQVNLQPRTSSISFQPKHKSKFMLVFVILLAVILVVLVMVLLATILFKEQVQAFFQPIFPSLFSSA